MCQILVFNAINTIDTDIECNIRIDRMPLVRTTTLGKSVYPDISLHISNYYIIMAPKQSLGDILCLLRFLLFLLLLFFFFFLSSAKSLSDTFLGDALIKLYETL